MDIETTIVGEFAVNCFVFWSDERRAAVVDPGSDADKIAAVIDRRDLTVDAYLLTHGHFDHLCALAELCKDHPAPVFCHAQDTAWAFTERNQMPPFYGPPERPDQPVRPVTDGLAGQAAGFDYRVIETPGHTPGSVCYLFSDEHVLFSGDTLFAGSIGRTDLPGGNPATMTASLRKLAELPAEVRVFPGHGPPTTVRNEKKTNFFMQRGAKIPS